ncbi:MAG: calcium/sodium antiporter [Clostridia bacterium]|nr:calcium/sodium antiporter [Clostridia bacterium]
MNLLLYILLFAFGLVLIIKGSDWFVDATIWIATALHIPKFIIGATLVSICTTLPELLVSTGAAINNDTSMALGNAIGSVGCNTGLILGIVVVFSTPLLHHKSALKIKSAFISLALVLYFLIGYFTGIFNYITGIIFLLFAAGFIYYNYTEAKKYKLDIENQETVATDKKTIIKNTVLFLIGLALTIFGANLMIIYGEKIAVSLNVPSIVIGVTMTALGTSLPELVTAITSLRKKAASLSIGNIFGANILNLTFVLGTTSIIKPVVLDNLKLYFHIPAIAVITLIASISTFVFKKKYPRFMGILLLLSYFIYIGLAAIIR